MAIIVKSEGLIERSNGLAIAFPRIMLLLLVVFIFDSVSSAQTNLAFGKYATQWMNYDAAKGLAGNAVDGNTSGRWMDGSVTHTMPSMNDQVNPWWEVDLAGTFSINEIQIWNRTDCCRERLDDISIWVRRTTAQDWELFAGSHRFDPAETYPLVFRGLNQARYVRIILGLKGPRPRVLSLAEVKVFGGDLRGGTQNERDCFKQIQGVVPHRNGNTDWNPTTLLKLCQGVSDPGPTVACFRLRIREMPDYAAMNACRNMTSATNLAFRKPVTQSSNADSRSGLASGAVDGNTSGNWANHSVTHTASSTNPWWQVDLGEVYNVNQIQIWNRTDCCGERLNDLFIFVRETQNADWKLFTSATYRFSRTETYPLTFSGNSRARYVLIRLNGSNRILSLAEVKVFGKRPNR